MDSRKIAIGGAGLVAAAGILWSVASFSAGDAVEGFLCFTFALGFAVAAGAFWKGGRHRWLASGFTVASFPAIYWSQTVIAAGAWDSGWALLGIGIGTAALIALLQDASFLPAPVRTAGLPIAFAVATAGALLLLVDDFARWTPWATAEILAVAGLSVLVPAARFTPIHQQPKRPADLAAPES